MTPAAPARPSRDPGPPPPQPAWLDRPGLTVSLAEARASIEFERKLAEAEKPRGKKP